ncbi:hypothetical protein [Telluria beijingensis]|uniref:hypothetical protein n=1 Tax=Telluria beijingensis TaxID=3068633 RepID=UPI0027953254|nr:hypothetical protein [Massilia sp. REN29]
MIRLAVLLALAAAAPGIAAAQDAVPSCYHAKLGVEAPAPATELFVLVDQTTLFDPILQQQVANGVRPFMAPDNAFSVTTFSAYSQGRYAHVVTSGTIEGLIAPALRDDISKPVLNKFDACTKRQPHQAMQAVGNALRGAFGGASPDLARSDVLASFKSIATRVKNSTARRKVVLIASDMLENSSVTAFYGNKGNSVRQVDPARELKIVVDNALLADFGGAEIYVIGAGLLGGDAARSNSYRDPKTMRALAGFWNGYFAQSNGQVIEIGQPALLNPVQARR